jgi:hypothetical protein
VSAWLREHLLAAVAALGVMVGVIVAGLMGRRHRPVPLEPRTAPLHDAATEREAEVVEEAARELQERREELVVVSETDDTDERSEALAALLNSRRGT